MGTIIFWVGLGFITLSYMTLWYFVSLYIKRLDLVDSAWGLGFVLVAWASLTLRANFGETQVVSAILVSTWGARLFAHIANRNWRRKEDDGRYQEMRAKWGSAVGRKAYTNVFLLQGVLILAISLPMVAIAFSSQHTPTAGIYLGWIVWIAGIATEAVADYQLGRFVRKRPPGSHAIMDLGLWRYSRHPNYFGELVTWWGAAIVALSIGEWWGVAGALVITLLITKISGIPPLEKRYEGNKAYIAYKHRTSVLIPLPPKRLNDK